MKCKENTSKEVCSRYSRGKDTKVQILGMG